VIESRTCLLPMITPQSRFLLRMYQHYKAGMLPYGGGILKQPHYYAEAMEIIWGEEARMMRELDESRRREARP
jgi:hypothetical protein